MNTKQAGAVAVAGLMIGTVVVPDHEQKHIEQHPTEPEPALLMDGAIIYTLSGTAPTIGQFSWSRPNQFE